MDRQKLGERLQQWHSSMGDPIYAVGSFYFAGQKYPNKEVVVAALTNLTEDLDKYGRMLKGEKVSQYNSYYGRIVDDLRAFAGYTDEQLLENIKDLTEISSALKEFLEKDY